VNAFMGMWWQAHGTTPITDYESAPHYSTTNSAGGTTTYYLAPNPVLPLTDPLRLVGVPDPIVDQIDNVLRPVIDAGYDRSAYTEPNVEVVETVAAPTTSDVEAETVPARTTTSEPKRATPRKTVPSQTSSSPKKPKKQTDHPAGNKPAHPKKQDSKPDQPRGHKK